MKGYKSKMVVNALGRCARHHRDTSNNPPLLPPQPRLNLQHGRTCNFLAGKATSRRGTTLPDILHRAATRQPGEATHPDKGASPTIPFAAHANIYIYISFPLASLVVESRRHQTAARLWANCHRVRPINLAKRIFLD